MPVFVQFAVIMLGMEKSSPRKTAGIIICFTAWVIFVIKYNIDEDEIFNRNFFMIAQIVAPGISSITLKKALGADGIGIFNLNFWVNVFGTACAFFYYGLQYHVDPRPPFFSYTYQQGLLDWAAIWVFLIVVDSFNLAWLTYITKTGQVSKAAVYSTLNATWTIFFGMIRGEYQLWIIFYLIAIYIGYSAINYDKKVAADKAKRMKIRVRFLQKVDNEYDIMKVKEFEVGSDIDDDEIMEKVGKHPYYVNFLFSRKNR